MDAEEERKGCGSDERKHGKDHPAAGPLAGARGYG